MIIGGANQGKLDFGKRKYQTVHWVDGAKCEFEGIYECEGIYHFHIYVRRMLEAGLAVESLAEDLIRRNERMIIISDEIGYGLVPIQHFDRNYREQTGRICTALAGHSDRVVRVVCGIGTVIKGDQL